MKQRILRRVLRGVYVDARVRDSRWLRAQALSLVKPPHAVFFGTTVAYLFGLDVARPSDRYDLVPQCIVPHHAVRCSSQLVRCVEGYLPPEDVTVVESLEVTTAVRTAVDLLRRMWRPYALAAADAFAHAGLVTVADVQAYLAGLRRYPGLVQARELSVLIEPLAESPGESWLRLRLIDAGFPRPQAQVVITDRHGAERARLDLGYEEVRIGAEYDGVRDHTEDGDREYDDERRRYLRELRDWRVVAARKHDVLGDDPWVERQVGGWLGMSPLLPRQW